MIPLTVREIQIFKLLSVGNSYKQISREIGISVPTIKFHVCNGKKKIGAKSIGHATALFIGHEK